MYEQFTFLHFCQFHHLYTTAYAEIFRGEYHTILEMSDENEIKEEIPYQFCDSYASTIRFLKRMVMEKHLRARSCLLLTYMQRFYVLFPPLNEAQKNAALHVIN